MTLKASPGRAVEKTFLEGQAVRNPNNAGAGAGAGQAGGMLTPRTCVARPRSPAWAGKALQTARGVLLGNSLQGPCKEVGGQRGKGTRRELTQ